MQRIADAQEMGNVVTFHHCIINQKGFVLCASASQCTEFERHGQKYSDSSTHLLYTLHQVQGRGSRVWGINPSCYWAKGKVVHQWANTETNNHARLSSSPRVNLYMYGEHANSTQKGTSQHLN